MARHLLEGSVDAVFLAGAWKVPSQWIAERARDAQVLRRRPPLEFVHGDGVGSAGAPPYWRVRRCVFFGWRRGR